MNLKSLDATLYIDGTTAFEYGRADLAPRERSCDFYAEFVPILKLGTPVTVICKNCGIPVLEIRGATYLSSRQLLRLTSIRYNLCVNAESAMEAAMDAQGKILPSGYAGRRAATPLTCQITAITRERIFFSCPGFDYKAKESIIEIKQPVFSQKTALHLHPDDKSLLFGKKPIYACLFYNLTEEQSLCIRNFIRTRAKNYLSGIFPPGSEFTPESNNANP